MGRYTFWDTGLSLRGAHSYPIQVSSFDLCLAFLSQTQVCFAFAPSYLMIQLKVAAGIAAAAVLGHAAVTARTRLNKPTDRQLRFSPGSQDEIVANGLKTGDVVLFRRDAATYPLATGLAVVLRQLVLSEREDATSSPQTRARALQQALSVSSAPLFDHVGVIVMKHGEPHVLEATIWGPQLLPYDARIRCSHCKKVSIRSLAAPLPPAAALSMEAFAAEASKQASPAAVAWFVEPMRDLGRAASSLLAARKEGHGTSSPATDLVAQAYAAAGLPFGALARPAPSSDHDARAAAQGASGAVGAGAGAVAVDERAAAPSAGTVVQDESSALTLQALRPPASPFPPGSILSFGTHMLVRDLR